MDLGLRTGALLVNDFSYFAIFTGDPKRAGFRAQQCETV